MPDKITSPKAMEPTPYGELDIIAQINFTSEPYCFDIGGVFLDPKTGELWWGTDAGCSCPCPWDYVRSTADLDGPHTLETIASVVLSKDGDMIGGATYQMRARRLVDQLFNDFAPTSIAA